MASGTRSIAAARALALPLLLFGACVDESAPAARGSKVVLPNLSGPGQRPARRPSATRRRAATLPASLGLGPGTVHTTWVEQRLGSTTQTILDLRPAQQFRRGHLPGARNDPEGRALLAAFLARRRAAATSKPATLPGPPPGRTVVLVHGGQDLRDRAVAARAYLVLYAGGAAPRRLAIMQGGYASWRRQRRPRSTAQANRPRPQPRPRLRPRPRPRPTSAPPATTTVQKRKAGTLSRPRRQVLLTDPVALATARKRPRTVLVHTGRRRPALRTRRPDPAWLRFGVAPLEPAPGALPHTATELRKRFGPLLTSGEKVRLIAFSDQGLWASLVWFTLKTRLGRSDALNAVYLGPGPLPRRIPGRLDALHR